LSLSIEAEKGFSVKVAKAESLTPVEGSEGKRFFSAGAAILEMSVMAEGPESGGIEILDPSLIGILSPDGASVSFTLDAKGRAAAEGSKVTLLAGNAAISEGTSGDGWNVTLEAQGDALVHQLVAQRAGEFPISIRFDAPLIRGGDWRSLDFRVPGGVIVPAVIKGLPDGLSFDRSFPVVPVRTAEGWQGYLAADGTLKVAWRASDAVEDGALFFSSSETSDVRVGNGLLRQSTAIQLRILQGKLPSLSVAIDGPGEILSVTGEPGLGWSVKETDGKRTIELTLSRPMEGGGNFRIEAQSALGGFPVKAQAMRFVPSGTLRHNGWLRVANEGAVRIEVADTSGLIQLAPSQFPGETKESLRQVFVYRFPSAEYAYSVQADQVLPEISVSEVTIHELAETDRRIHSDIELDIREAPLREWEMIIPADYAVAAVTGSAVSDYAVGTEVKANGKTLKIFFKETVSGRQLVSIRLERNETAKAGPWSLPKLVFTDAKSHRGYIGASGVAGYRLVPGANTGVAEIPLTFFPKKAAGLQQAFRVKEATWKVDLTVEALGQSVQADVFHLYSLKEGAVYGSVLMNFFVVGAPSTEWRISVPPGIGNVDVSGQNVGRDWRREGDVVIVPLSRPVLGAGTILLTFEQSMNARGGTISPGEIKPLNVQGERGYVQVVSPLQVKHQVTKSEGALLKLDPSELPAEFRLLSTAPVLELYQYTSRDFSIALEIERYAHGDTTSQIVDFLKLDSRVSKDGQWVTDARFFVKSKEGGTLRLRLPKGVTLWETKVSGQSVNARKDGDETLVPLPAVKDPNLAIEVSLRYGDRSKKANRPELAAPVTQAPVVIGEWTVTGDEGRVLLPAGGNARLIRQERQQSGWSWLGGHIAEVLLFFGCVASMIVLGTRKGHIRWLGAVFGVIALVIGAALAMKSFIDLTQSDSGRVLEYMAPVVSAGSQVTVGLANLPAWRANAGIFVWLLIIGGIAAWCAAKVMRLPGMGALAAMLVTAGILTIRGGAVLFFIAVGLVILAWWYPRVRAVLRNRRLARVAKAVAVPMIACMLLGAGHADAAIKPAESMQHVWRIHEGRLQGSIDVTVRGAAGDRFLLLKYPDVLRGFTTPNADALKVVKVGADQQTAYYLELGNDGAATGQVEFEMPLADPSKEWHMPGGPAVARRVDVRWKEAGWEFHSPDAASVTVPQGLAPGESGAVMILKPSAATMITARPKQRDAATEETRFFAEISNLFLPGPGVVAGRHKVAIRPSQGRVGSLVMRVPEGFTVSDVTEGPVGTWRFDPGKRELRVSVEPAQEQAFSLLVETQRGAGALPVGLTLEPMRLSGAAGEVGLLAVAFGDDAQPESILPEGLSRVNPEDFTLAGNPGEWSVLHAFRYGGDAAKLKLNVAAVAPEVRAESFQLVSLGEDRLVIAADLVANITRSGVFRLTLSVPDGLEIESATGESLSHWTESGKGKDRVITLHLTGRTMGTQKFSLTLAGPMVPASASWNVPRISLKEASRQTGLITIVPDRGLQVRSVNRVNVSPVDPREVAGGAQEAAKAASRPGALAFRMLQADWTLALSIAKLDPWVTAKVLHDVTLREGQILSRVSLAYRIENSALKTLRVRIPGLDAEAEATVRATGPAVADFVPVPGEEGLWEIRFQRGIAGETQVDVEYQRRGAGTENESFVPVVPEQVRQLSYFAAVRTGGRIEVEAGTTPRGWQRVDWPVVRSGVGAMAGREAPVMAFRVAEPEGPLELVIKRHELAGAERFRVSSGELTSLISPEGNAITAVQLNMDVTAKGSLKLRLPKGSDLFNVIVNDEAAALVREGDAWLFQIQPRPENGVPASLRFVYSAENQEGRLEGPRLEVPMENLSWRVLVPEGWKLSTRGGDFDLKDSVHMGMFRLEDYQSFVSSKRAADSASAAAMLDQANAWLKQGDQERASIALGNAVNRNLLDEASNEDARVQLRALKTQQAVLGINTRRQKLVLDQNAAQGQKDQLEKAAEANPVLRGGVNYDPQEFDRFTAGNTADENAALKEIANRIVNQQLAVEPAPAALDVTLPERGEVLTFGRGVQTDGSKAMAIDFSLRKENRGGWWIGLSACLLVGILIKSRSPISGTR
jgi:hypothetical protein